MKRNKELRGKGRGNRFVVGRHGPGILRFGLILLILGVLTVAATAKETTPIIRKIEIAGNRRIDSGTIRERIKSRVGEPLSLDTIREDIRSIYRMGGYFKNVQVESDPFADGIRLTFRVEEKPIISEISIQGNKELDEGKIRDVLHSRIGSPYDRQRIKEDKEAIRKLYQNEGYYFAGIDIQVREDKNHNKKILYHIAEGKKVIIGEIFLKGAKHLKPGEIKKKAMETKEHWMLSFISSAGLYKKEILDIDLQRIKDYYYSHGYLEAKIGEPVISFKKPRKRSWDRFYEFLKGWWWSKNMISITIPISEGQQYRIKKIAFQGNAAIPESVLRSSLSSKAGETFSSRAIRRDMRRISKLYGAKGYAFAGVSPLTELDRDTRTVNLTWDIDEGQPVYIGEVTIVGNTQTRDNVIRRELRFNEGDQYNIAKIDRSKIRIQNTGFFKKVRIATNRRPGEQVVDLKVQVEEQQTGSLSFGVGASSTQGLIGSFDIRENNLFGTGRELNLAAELGGQDTTFNIHYIDPWLYDREISLGVSLFKTFSNYESFEEDTVGGSLTVGKALDEYSRGSIGVNYEEIHFSNVDQNFEQGLTQSQSVFGISFGWQRNTVDNIVDPTRGYLARMNLKFAGLLGNANFNKYFLSDRIFFKGPWKTTFSLNGEAGFVDAGGPEDVPVSELFFLGGIESLRGYQYRSLGPKNYFGSLIGGRKSLLLNSEYYIPLAPSLGLKGFLFFDIGKVYAPLSKTTITSMKEIDRDGDGFTDAIQAVRSPNLTDGNAWKKSYGIGFYWRSPAGPIKIVWAKALSPEPFDNLETIQFNMGTTF